MDMMATAKGEWPRSNATTMGDFAAHPGGKGANEAVALARLGVGVAMVGRVGADPQGERLKDHLEREGVDTSGVLLPRVPDSDTWSGS